MDEAHEGCECFLTAQCDPSKAFEPVEEAFDLMTLLVEPPVDWRDGRSAWVGFDLGGRPEVVSNEGT